MSQGFSHPLVIVEVKHPTKSWFMVLDAHGRQCAVAGDFADAVKYKAGLEQAAAEESPAARPV